MRVDDQTPIMDDLANPPGREGAFFASIGSHSFSAVADRSVFLTGRPLSWGVTGDCRRFDRLTASRGPIPKGLSSHRDGATDDRQDLELRISDFGFTGPNDELGPRI